MKLFFLILNIYLVLFSFGNSTSIEIKKISSKTSKFEIMEMTFDDYRIYNHRQGAIKIRRISNNQQLVVLILCHLGLFFFLNKQLFSDYSSLHHIQIFVS